MSNDKIIRFQALPRWIRWHAQLAGRRDGRAELPSGDPAPGIQVPGADAVVLRWDSAIAVLDQEYRTELRGLLPVLRRSVPGPIATDAPYGPEARAARAAEARADAAAVAKEDAADEVLLLTERTRAAILEVDAVRRQALAVYTNSLLRHHPNAKGLSTVNWRPGVAPLPSWVAVPGPDLVSALRACGYVALDQ